MFRASSAHIHEDTVVHMQHMVLSLCKHVSGRVLLKHVQLYPPEDEHLRLETCRGE